jgi:hypothetical protein
MSRAPLPALLAFLLLLAGLLMPPLPSRWLTPAWAGPVDWHEVPATTEGRQWWDAGSLRIDRDGRLSVLSRFQPAPPASSEAEEAGRSGPASLYVMQLDCDQALFRDVSVNGLPRFRSPWQAVADDALGGAVIREACAAWADQAPT